MSTEATSITGPTVDAGGVPVSAQGVDAGGGTSAPLGQRVSHTWEGFEGLLARASDLLNPILVKETRQALKSFQFTITFVLVLVAAWVVTFGVGAYVGPRIYYAAAGGTMLLWYYIVLTFPLLVVVPLAAYRSLSIEREDNTYALLSITTLKSRQIISGKLGSSLMQMAVYFSAITPCLAFTYLLRGLDIPTIAILLTHTFFWSLGLSMIGLLLATLTQQRFAQGIILVGFVAALLLMFYWSIEISNEVSIYGRMVLGGTGQEFWIFTAGAATFYATFFALAFFAAAGMITFLSENRSTPLRICMLVQQAAFVGWIGYAWISNEHEFEFPLIGASVAVFYWFVMGALLTAERHGMSQRVKRHLPQSFLGRLFAGWLIPGPATGYMFVVANATALVVLCLLAATKSAFSNAGPPLIQDVINMLVVGWAYLVGYLGLGLLVISVLRRFSMVTMLAGVLINLLLVLAGFGIPTALKLMSIQLRDADYTFLQVTDPFASLVHISEGAAINDIRKLLIAVPAAAVCILLANMPAVIREQLQTRIEAPTRVLEDEAELHPPPESGPSNPWDEPHS